MTTRAEERKLDGFVAWLAHVEQGSRNVPAAWAPDDLPENAWPDPMDG